MITRPSTAQIVAAVRRELADVIAPEVTSPHAVASLQMLDNVLHNLEVRAGHEIAWMREEAALLEAETAAALDRLADDHRPRAVAEALDAYRRGRTGGLHYDDVQADYDRASEAFARVVEAAVYGDDPHLREHVTGLLQARLARELEIMGEFGFVGRG